MGEITSGASGKGWHAAGNYPPSSAAVHRSSWLSLKVNGPGFHLIPCAYCSPIGKSGAATG